MWLFLMTSEKVVKDKSAICIFENTTHIAVVLSDIAIVYEIYPCTKIVLSARNKQNIAKASTPPWW